MQAIHQFCGQKNGYSRSITLRNRLIPIGKTEENIQKFLESDKNRADKYPGAKQLIDNLHRDFIAEVLSTHSFDWQPLADSIEKFQKTKDARDKKNLQTQQTNLRKQIAKAFSSSEKGKKLFSKELFTELLPEYIKGKVDEKANEEIVKEFDRFTTYFTGFYDNRKNMYSDEEQATAISFRLVNENFPKFLTNAKLFQEIKGKYPEIINDALKSLKNEKIDSYFEVNGFNACLTQQGIDAYNQVLGGTAAEAGQEKSKGLNECINLYKQQHSDVKIGKMSMLYKQILSDRDGSFIDAFEKDEDVFKAVQSYHEILISQLSEIEKLFVDAEYDLDKIIVPVKKLTEYSQVCTGRWNVVEESIRQNFIAKHGEPKKKKDEDALDKELKKDQSLLELKNILASAPSMEGINIVDYLNNDNLVKQTFSSVELEVKNLEEGFVTLIQKISYKDGSDLKQKDDDVEHIKIYLDCALNLYHYLELVDYRGEAEKDGDFYSTYEKVIERLSGILFLYNKVRNYVTKKIDTEKKFKLNFDSPTLANGWDANKESANNAIILRKNGKYYLGIFNPNDKPKIDNEATCDASDCYEKMVYKLLPGPNKMLPKVFFSKKGLETFNPPKEILEGYTKEQYKKGDTFDIIFCHKLIDWFKDAINQHPDWKKFNFKFSKTESYADISEFYREITEQGYKISFTKIAESEIQNLVDCGKLFLFQIYNKDYAENSCGSKNLHTLYWENLFSEENLKNTVLKLNGEAELFFRPQVIKEDKIIAHKKDSYLVNRIGKDGKRIPESFYQEIYKKANGIIDKISDEAKEFEKNAVVKKATHDIVKDRRFTQNVYQFHCPITMNFKAAELTGKKFNERVQELLAKDPTVKVIGIDRGERHLLYLSLINQKGEIELQKTLNLVELNRNGQTVQVDYQQKLTLKEKERDNARKNWKTINNIKEIKEGYLSAVVHEIAKMMVEHNAIVVMEELNYGFKRGRFPVERQVYQKFELALIEKLNFLVFKNKNVSEAGGVLNAFQLTQKPDSLTDFGKQNGWIFYIPAAYTSKIDPKTGFIDFFKLSKVATKNLTNMDAKKSFFKQYFQQIEYDKVSESFAFSFEVPDDVQSHIRKWTVYSRGERIKYNPKDKQSFKVNPTEDLKKIFDEKNIEWTSGRNILEDIINVPSEKNNAAFFDKLYQSFTSILQMRNSVANSTNPEDDYLISPVKAADGTFYDSRNYKDSDKLPCDADANGAYHIALKGLYLLKNNFNKNDKGSIENISHADWFKFVQKRAF
ncbi:MAG: type V CRISPR-associated protein Cas12a/Cpf1 [Lachnospiraceae bacterium]|nr:type V CRISPR-associated protein Cas12a/Cpf1 [Lachnospiraceae bacterium]